MALLEFNSTIDNKPDMSAVFSVSTQQENAVICKSPGKLKLLLDKIIPGTSIHYVSKGDWSMHDLVMQLINKNSPAEVYLSTYAIRETPLRNLIIAQQKGLITSLNMLIDYRAKVRTPEVYQLAKINANKIFLIAIHAKVCVIKSENSTISIVTSSNWTTNPKIEAGVVSTDKTIGNFHIDWMVQTMNNAEIFK